MAVMPWAWAWGMLLMGLPVRLFQTTSMDSLPSSAVMMAVRSSVAIMHVMELQWPCGHVGCIKWSSAPNKKYATAGQAPHHVIATEKNADSVTTGANLTWRKDCLRSYKETRKFALRYIGVLDPRASVWKAIQKKFSLFKCFSIGFPGVDIPMPRHPPWVYIRGAAGTL
eukprot:1161765-Pelagomonas_calceolata.AAC.12